VPHARYPWADERGGEDRRNRVAVSGPEPQRLRIASQ
jgi:hypothetical protein